MLDRDPTLHYVGQTCLTWSTNCSRLFFYTAWVAHTHLKGAPLSNISRAKLLYRGLLRHWGDHAHWAFAPLGGLTSLNITHTHNYVQGMILIPIEGLVTSSQKTSLLGEVVDWW